MSEKVSQTTRSDPPRDQEIQVHGERDEGTPAAAPPPVARVPLTEEALSAAAPGAPEAPGAPGAPGAPDAGKGADAADAALRARLPMAMEIRVPNVGQTVTQRMPTDMRAPGYIFASSVEAMVLISRFVSPEEWAALSTGVNESIRRHHYCSSPLAMTPMFCTLGLCFCPMLYVACGMSERVTADMEQLPVTKALNARGIALYWTSMRKFHPGGITFHITPTAPPLVQKMGR